MDFPKYYWHNEYGIIQFFILRDHRSKFLDYDITMSLKIVFTSANSAGPDEMPPWVAFHLGLHCLPKIPVYLYPKWKKVYHW